MRALEKLEKLIGLDDACLEAVIYKADLLYEIDSFNRAKENYLIVIAKSPNNIYSLFQLGNIYLLREIYDSSIIYLNSAISFKHRGNFILDKSGSTDKFNYDVNSVELYYTVYDRKTAITSADLLNVRVLPFFEQQGIPLLRILTDRGTEYKGKPEHHEFELYLRIEGIEHSKTQVKHPQSNGICERLHRTMQEEFYAVAFRKKLYDSLEYLQADLDKWMQYYNQERPHSGRYCYGKTPMQTFLDSQSLALDKMLNSVPSEDNNQSVSLELL